MLGRDALDVAVQILLPRYTAEMKQKNALIEQKCYLLIVFDEYQREQL